MPKSLASVVTVKGLPGSGSYSTGAVEKAVLIMEKA
jgi:hypothetical protein